MTIPEERVSAPLVINPIVSSGERERLILDGMGQVRLIARRIWERIPTSVSLDDLISAGVVGLIAAIDRYDHSHRVKLKTYAEYKIKGAILDSLRMSDWAPRRQRRRSRAIEQAIAVLEQQLQRAPQQNEIAAHLGLTLAEYQDWLTHARHLTIGRLESGGTNQDGNELLKTLADSDDTWPSEIVERSELQRLLALAIERMPATERTVLHLFFFEEISLREISKVLNLHESRISQLKTQGILRLRSILNSRLGPVRPNYSIY